MVVSINDLEKALGDILAKANEAIVKNVIGTYDTAKSVEFNIKILCSTFQRDALKDTVAFLKVLAPDYPVQVSYINAKSRNKDEYSRDIITFIDLLKPTLCLTCNTNYVPTGDDHSVDHAKCFICKRPSHNTCYDKHHIQPDIGVFFVCSECISVKQANKLSECLQQQQSQSEDKNDKAEDKKEKPGDSSIVLEEETSDGDDHANDQKVIDCPLYKKRSCPHGLTGKREINGQPCKYRHRRLCHFFAQSGPSGCNYKNKCRFLHPPVCQNSLALQACFNKSCTEFHLKGTHRFPRENRDPYKPNNPPPISPWNEPAPAARAAREHMPRQADAPGPPKNEGINDPTRHFLERFLEEMKADFKTYASSIIKSTSQPQLVLPVQHSQQSVNLPNHQEVPHQLPQPPSSIPNHQLLQDQTQLTPGQQIYYSKLYNQNFPQMTSQQPQPV